MYDIIICGAGVAGCSFARYTASKGLKVLLLDKKPKEKLGHDWWDAVTQEVFKDTQTPPPLPPERLHYSASIYTSPDGKTRMQMLSGKKFSIDRKLLAKRLLKIALEAGTEFQDKTKVLKPIVSEDRIRGVYVQDRNKEERDVFARLIVDATGIDAILRKQIPFESDFEKEIRREDTFILYREIREATTSRNERIVRFGHHKGVSWISFRQKGLVDILAGIFNLPNHDNPKNIVKEYLEEYKEDIGDKIIRAGYVGIIPVRRCLDSFIANNFLLMGDSASQINPIDGSGVAASMYAGYYAAFSVVQAFKQNKPLDKKTLWNYNFTYKTKIGSDFVALDIIRLFLMGRNDQEQDLNYLFKRGIIEARDIQRSNEQKSTFSTLKKLLKGIDRISLLKNLRKTIRLSKEAAAVYRDYPPEYEPSKFADWQKKLRAIYDEIPTE
jgi:electron-transferring-flavoprotein dehydrogenase